MKKTAVLSLALLMICAAGATMGGSKDGPAANPRAAALEQELALAKTPGMYFLFDFKKRRIDLKFRGLALKTWEIARTKVWGRDFDVRISKLERKSTLFPPKRANITPKPGEEADIELDVLELDKMPTHFSLYFGEKLRIKVRPKTRKFGKMVLNAGAGIVWYGFLPLKTVWMSLRKKPFTEIEIVTKNEKDAKAIYWAFYEGQSCLIYHPR